MTEKERKAKFVGDKLKPLLCAMQCEVKNAEYSVTDNGEEYVTVTYTSGFDKRICVSADSLRAIAVDVIINCG